nr:uncharacterized protein LOC129439904 isoform X2 [Misgurnus anguillicaudatus]
MAAQPINPFRLTTTETRARIGSDITLQCHVSSEITFDVDMEIRWFKGTDCVCLYKNGKVIEGRGYENRVRSLFTEVLRNGDVSLTLKCFRRSDIGDYMCQVNNGDRKEEINIRVKKVTQHLCTSYGALAAGVLALAVALALAVTKETRGTMQLQTYAAPALPKAARKRAGRVLAATVAQQAAADGAGGGGAAATATVIVATAAAGLTLIAAAAIIGAATFVKTERIERTWSDVERMEIKRSALMTVSGET